MSQEVPQDLGGEAAHSSHEALAPHEALVLHEALARMRWSVEPGRFGLLGFPERPGTAALALLGGRGPAQVIREGGETTCLAALEALEEVRAAHPQARLEAPLVWVRFELPMAWDLVGFLAHVTAALTAAGVSVGAVCGYSRDHLFLADSAWERARVVLETLFGPGDPGPESGANEPQERSSRVD